MHGNIAWDQLREAVQKIVIAENKDKTKVIMKAYDKFVGEYQAKDELNTADTLLSDLEPGKETPHANVKSLVLRCKQVASPGSQASPSI